MSTQNTIVKVLAEAIISKDNLMKVGIESKKAEILTENIVWGENTQTSLVDFTALINSNRSSSSSIEAAKIAQIQTDLLALRDIILDNPSIDLDSFKEANAKLDSEMENFNKSLSDSVQALLATRTQFATNVGDANDFSLNSQEDYSSEELNLDGSPDVPSMVRVEILQRTTPLSFFKNIDTNSFTNRINFEHADDVLPSTATPLYIKLPSTPSDMAEVQEILKISSENICLEQDFYEIEQKRHDVIELQGEGVLTEAESITQIFSGYTFWGNSFEGITTLVDLGNRIADLKLNQTFLEVKLTDIISEDGSFSKDWTGADLDTPVDYATAISNDSYRLTLMDDADYASEGFMLRESIQENQVNKSLFSHIQFSASLINQQNLIEGPWNKTIASGDIDDMIVPLNVDPQTLPDLTRSFTSGNALIDKYFEEGNYSHDLDPSTKDYFHNLTSNGYFYHIHPSNGFTSGIIDGGMGNDSIGYWFDSIDFGDFKTKNPFLWGIMNIGLTMGYKLMKDYYNCMSIQSGFHSTEIWNGQGINSIHFNTVMQEDDSTYNSDDDWSYSSLFTTYFPSQETLLIDQFSSFDFQSEPNFANVSIQNPNYTYSQNGVFNDGYFRLMIKSIFSDYISSFWKRYGKYRTGNLIPISEAIKEVKLVNHADLGNTSYADIRVAFDKSIIDDAYGKGLAWETDENGNLSYPWEGNTQFDAIYKNSSYRFYSSMNPSLTEASDNYVPGVPVDQLIEAGKTYKVVNSLFDSFQFGTSVRQSFPSHNNNGEFAINNFKQLGFREEDGDYVSYFLASSNINWSNSHTFFYGLSFKDRNGKAQINKITRQNLAFDEANSTWNEQSMIDAAYPYTTGNYSLFKYGYNMFQDGMSWANGNPYLLQESGFKLKLYSLDETITTYQGAIPFPHDDYPNYQYGTNWYDGNTPPEGAYCIENQEFITSAVARKYFNILVSNAYNRIYVYMSAPGGYREYFTPDAWNINFLYSDYTPGYEKVEGTQLVGMAWSQNRPFYPMTNIEFDSNYPTKPNLSDNDHIYKSDSPFTLTPTSYILDSEGEYSPLDMSSYTGNIYWHSVVNAGYAGEGTKWHDHFKNDDLGSWLNSIGFNHNIAEHKYINGSFILESNPYSFPEIVDGSIVYHPEYTTGDYATANNVGMLDWQYLEAANYGTQNFLASIWSNDPSGDYAKASSSVSNSSESMEIVNKFYGGSIDNYIKHKNISTAIFKKISPIGTSADVFSDDTYSSITDGKVNIKVEAGKTINGTIVPTTAHSSSAYSLSDPSSNYIGIAKTSATISAGTVWEAKGGSISELETLMGDLYQYFKASIDSVVMEDEKGNLFISPELYNWCKTGINGQQMKWSANEDGSKSDNPETAEGGFYMNAAKGWAKIWSPYGGSNNDRNFLYNSLWNQCLKSITFDETPAVNSVGEDVFGTINIVLNPLSFESFQLGALEKPWNAILDMQVNNYNPTDLTFTTKFGKVTSEMISNDCLSSHFFANFFYFDGAMFVDLDGNSTRFVLPEVGPNALQDDGSGIGYTTQNTFPQYTSYTYNQYGSPSTNKFSAGVNDVDGDGIGDDVDLFPLDSVDGFDVDWDAIGNNVDSDPYSADASYSIIQDIKTDEEIAVHGNLSLRGWSIGECKILQDDESVRHGYEYLRNEAGNFDTSGMTIMSLDYIKGGPDTVLFDFGAIFTEYEFSNEALGGIAIALGNGYTSISDKTEALAYIASYEGIEAMGTITFTLKDSYGDGWNQNTYYGNCHIKITSMKSDGSSNGDVYFNDTDIGGWTGANTTVVANLEGNSTDHSFFKIEVKTSQYGSENSFDMLLDNGKTFSGPTGPIYGTGGTTGGVFTQSNTGAQVSSFGNNAEYYSYFTWDGDGMSAAIEPFLG